MASDGQENGAAISRRDLLGAGLAGGTVVLSLPPFGWWPLGVLGLAMLARLTDRQSWRDRLLLGLVAGVAFFGLGLLWVTAFSLPGYGALVALEAVLLAGGLAAVPPGRGQLLGFPAALVLAEWARGRWPFGGLPVGGLALGQVGGPFGPVARFSGALGVMAVTGMVAAALAALWSRPVRRRAGLAALGGVSLLVVAAPRLPSGTASARIVAAVVQGGGPRGIRAIDADPGQVLDRHVAATAGVRNGIELVIWPEGVVDVAGEFQGSSEETGVGDLARRLDTTFVVGVVEGAPGGRFRNAAVALGPNGAVVDRYDKVHRVPFGEYVPARRLIGAVADLSAVPRDAVPGRGPGLLHTEVGRLGVMISYEVFFSDRARAAVRAGGAVLVVPTNASSYTGRQVPAQEVAAARLRAIETGRYVLQAAPTGYSAIIEPSGRVQAQSQLGVPAVLQRRVELRSGVTIYVRVGDRPLLGACLLVLVLTWARRWRRQRVRRPGLLASRAVDP